MLRLCVVCGGSRGIGRAVSRLLAERACRVVVVSRNQHAAQATVASLDGEEVQKMFEMILKTCGNISYLVNAAGTNRDGLLLWTRLEDMVAMLHTNLLGSMLSCKAALRSMLHTQGGAIVNIDTGLKGNAGQCVYSASKAGLEGFTLSLAMEAGLAKCPGFIRTDMTAGLGEGVSAFNQPFNICFLISFLYTQAHVFLTDFGVYFLILIHLAYEYVEIFYIFFYIYKQLFDRVVSITWI
uniref:3-ketoacyl-[acyl-carrier-protein] reductase beta subunit n=1 Tax=Hucho hucho TaxID=62062 RepID=A0A4W5PL62_9TELE